MNELAVVMPVYNEEGAIGGVLEKWVAALDRLRIDYRIHVYNDGSTDGTQSILTSFSADHPQVVVHPKPNSGHGPTILQGYRENRDAPWIFQMDSDDELGPEGFPVLWERRGDYDFLLGVREGRNGTWVRRLVTRISAVTVRLFYGAGIRDVNSPYRLMRTEKFRELFQRIPSDTFAPNVLITGFACRGKLRLFEAGVPFQDRRTGTVSIRKWKLLKASARSFAQTIRFARSA